MRICINGIGIGGPTLAYWLRKSGHEVVLVEESPRLRSGGYVIDFWGLGYDIAEKMGLIPRIRELGYQVREVRFVDRRGRKSGGFAVDVFGRITNGRFTSVRRSDLAATLYGALDDQVETIFGDSVAGIDDCGDRVRVSFEHAAAREVDLVIGADGLHSRVRKIVFGPKEPFEVSLGYHVAAFEVDGYRPRDELVYLSYGVPGRQVSRFSMRDDKTLFLFVFLDEYLPGGRLADRAGTQGGAAARVRGRGMGVSADSGGDGGRERHLFRPREPDSDGPVDEGTDGARRRRGGVRFATCRRRDGTGDGRGICAGRRTARMRRRSCIGVCTVRGADDAVSEAQAGVGGEVCVVVLRRRRRLAFGSATR